MHDASGQVINVMKAIGCEKLQYLLAQKKHISDID